MWEHFNIVYDPGANGMAPCYLTFSELLAYNQATGAMLTMAEMVLIRRLSEEYVIIAEEKRKKATPPSKGKGGGEFKPVDGVQGLKDLFSKQGNRKQAR